MTAPARHPATTRGLALAFALMGTGLALASSTMPATGAGRIGVGLLGMVLVLAGGLLGTRVAWVAGWAE